jgi:hypothetical protein
MSLTVAAYYARLGPRLGPCAGLADLPDALYYALRESSLGPANPPVIVDADVAAVPAATLSQVDDLAMARAFETILDNLIDPLLVEAGVKATAAELRPYYERRLGRLQDTIKSRYGIGLPIPSAGIVTLDFAARGDDTLDGLPGVTIL